ncbi:MAG: hypothetical protein AVDCRST_MAG87-2362, partial [uncultured Thermomicrobiales bacterium]
AVAAALDDDRQSLGSDRGSEGSPGRSALSGRGPVRCVVFEYVWQAQRGV